MEFDNIMTLNEVRSARRKTAGGGYRWYLSESWSSYKRFYHGSMQYSLWKGDSIHPTTDQLRHGSVQHLKTLKECEDYILRIENAQTDK